MSAPTGSPNLPPRFDDYVLVGPLGRGGMGEVHLARDVALDRPVAIKVMLPGPSTRAREQLLREARALARMSHPNVVAVYRVGEVAGRPYVAYEYVAGQSLDKMPTPMPWPDVLDIGSQVARGLEAAHALELLHRDIKPANVVLCPDGRAKLIDFGLAQAAERREESVDGALGAHDSGERRKLVGTPAYMAPELWRGEAASRRSDVHALGLLLHELLVGAPAYGGGDVEAIRRRIATEDVRPIASLRPDVPKELAALIERCTDRRPERRPRDGGELREALHAIATGNSALGILPASSWHQSRNASDEVSALQASFLRARIGGELASRVYAHLFARDPSLRDLFPRELGAQRLKLEQALHLAVGALRRREELEPLLESVGARHAHAPIGPAAFAVFRDSLLDALREADHAEWGEALESTWSAAIEAMNAHVIAGMEAARGAEAFGLASHPPPRTHYAEAGGVSVAYQAFGKGPVDLLFMPGFISHVEAAWSLPEHASFLRALGRMARVILVDKRGTGLSDRTGVDLPVEHRMRDLPAVLDAVGAERAVVFGVMDGSVTASAFAAAHPERVLGLVLYATGARLVADEDYPHGIPLEVFEGACEAIRRAWGAPLFAERAAPSRASDPAFLSWWADFLRHGASPGAALELFRRNAEFDLTPLLPQIRTPTLVAHRRGDAMMSLAGGRFVADRIEGARWLELEGADHLPYIGDTTALLAAIRSFIAEVAPGAQKERAEADARAMTEGVREPSWVTVPIDEPDD